MALFKPILIGLTRRSLLADAMGKQDQRSHDYASEVKVAIPHFDPPFN